jgi:DNA-binding IclR family transcriptional regulator
MEKTDNFQGIQVISRAADILRALGQDTGGLSLGQIASRVQLPRSTVQRIVGSLAREGLVAAEKAGGSIRLGPEIQTLAAASRADIFKLLTDAMKSISAETGETVDLARLEGRRMLFIDQIVGSQRLRTVSNIGETFPLTTTANGKAALSLLDQSQAAKLILSEFDSLAEPSRSLADALVEIDAISKSGLAFDHGEHTDGISAMGMAMKDEAGHIFALSIPVPTSRFQRVQVELERVLGKWNKSLLFSR